MDKGAVRAWVRERKRAMTQAEIREKSRRLGELLFQTELYRRASAIYGYLSYNQEVRTEDILKRAMADGKKVAVPKVYGEEMRFLYLSDLSQTAPGYAGIPEPVADGPVADDPFALVLMPGLAFDAAGRRIGYGGGFYDKFLAREQGHPTLALCYDFQVFDRLETEEYDKKVDCVLWA